MCVWFGVTGSVLLYLSIGMPASVCVCACVFGCVSVCVCLCVCLCGCVCVWVFVSGSADNVCDVSITKLEQS